MAVGLGQVTALFDAGTGSNRKIRPDSISNCDIRMGHKVGFYMYVCMYVYYVYKKCSISNLFGVNQCFDAVAKVGVF